MTGGGGGWTTRHAKRGQRNLVHLAWKRASCGSGGNLIIVCHSIKEGYREGRARLFSDVHN